MTAKRNPHIETVDTFLKLFEARELGQAATLMTASPTIIFPPGTRYGSLSELSGGLKKNYNWVKKHRDTFSLGQEEDGRTVVVSHGRLCGEDLGGAPFDDIYYIDYFVFEGDLIAEQRVWNHLASAGIIKVA